jgi:hypothetical protein
MLSPVSDQAGLENIDFWSNFFFSSESYITHIMDFIDPNDEKTLFSSTSVALVICENFGNIQSAYVDGSFEDYYRSLISKGKTNYDMIIKQNGNQGISRRIRYEEALVFHSKPSYHYQTKHIVSNQERSVMFSDLMTAVQQDNSGFLVSRNNSVFVVVHLRDDEWLVIDPSTPYVGQVNGQGIVRALTCDGLWDFEIGLVIPAKSATQIVMARINNCPKSGSIQEIMCETSLKTLAAQCSSTSKHSDDVCQKDYDDIEELSDDEEFSDGDQSDGDQSDQVIEQPDQEVVEQLDQEVIEQPDQEVVEQPDQVIEQPDQVVVEQPVQVVVEQPVHVVVEQPVQVVVEQPDQEVIEQPDQEVIEQPVNETNIQEAEHSINLGSEEQNQQSVESGNCSIN